MRIWTAQLDALESSELARLHRLLDETERIRAARFHFEQDRRRYVASHGLLRELLGDLLVTAPASIQFVHGARGKPAAAQPESKGRSLRFNLSHSAGSAMFAFAWDREVGIDLESTARLAPADEHLPALAARILSTREFDLWRALPDPAARRAAFLRAWTRKEAFAKATGAGIFDSLRDIEVILDIAAPAPSLTVARPADQAANGWVIHDVEAPEGFTAAVAIARLPA